MKAPLSMRVTILVLCFSTLTYGLKLFGHRLHIFPLSYQALHNPAAKSSQYCKVFGTATAVQDAATEPFSLVQSDLRNLKRRIKTLVESNVGSNDKTKAGSSNPLLQAAAREFFERRERAWRPSVVLLMARALTADGDNDESSNDEAFAKHLMLAEIVEMMSTAQFIHDDVLEDFQSKEIGNVAHKTYDAQFGNKISLLAGDFLLARASVELARLTNVAVVEIMGSSLENMCRGEIMHAQAYLEDKLNSTYYIDKVSLKTASLLSHACLSSALLRGFPVESSCSKAASDFGLNIGIAYQIKKDTMAYQALTSPEEVPSVATMNEIIVALPPLALSSAKNPMLYDIIMRGFGEPGDVECALRLVEEEDGIRMSTELARRHVNSALKSIQSTLPESEYKRGLTTMCEYVVQDEQIGLQRAEWREKQLESG